MRFLPTSRFCAHQRQPLDRKNTIANTVQLSENSNLCLFLTHDVSVIFSLQERRLPPYSQSGTCLYTARLLLKPRMGRGESETSRPVRTRMIATLVAVRHFWHVSTTDSTSASAGHVATTDSTSASSHHTFTLYPCKFHSS